jgi:hypothetical protein
MPIVAHGRDARPIGGLKAPHERVVPGVAVEDVEGNNLTVLIQLNAVPKQFFVLAVDGSANPVRLKQLDAKRKEASAFLVTPEGEHIARIPFAREGNRLLLIEVEAPGHVRRFRFRPKVEKRFRAGFPCLRSRFHERPSNSRFTLARSLSPEPTTFVLDVPRAPRAIGALRPKSRERERRVGKSPMESASAEPAVGLNLRRLVLSWRAPAYWPAKFTRNREWAMAAARCGFTMLTARSKRVILDAGLFTVILTGAPPG